MHCAEFEEPILEYFGVDLPEAARRRVDQHVAVCDACHGFWETQRNLDNALATSLTPPQLSPAFRRRVLERIDVARERRRAILTGVMDFVAASAAVVTVLYGLEQYGVLSALRVELPQITGIAVWVSAAAGVVYGVWTVSRSESSNL
jgi:anti-sigma factor RsiW